MSGVCVAQLLNWRREATLLVPSFDIMSVHLSKEILEMANKVFL